MSDEVKRDIRPRSRPPVLRKGSSGGHPIIQAVRKKLDSIREGTLPELEALNRRIDKLKDKSESDPPATTEEPIPDTEPEVKS